MSWGINSQKTRFDSLPEEVQERIVNVLMKNLVPDTAGYDIDEETLQHWAANRSILAFWVRHKQMRKKKD
ncbi:hypothetical protein [Prosthecobacter fluviatilis]|uniref:Uncharacterized protein n=1 Tax=Prosthecobacter fluviatilis TaxID=445931 RepID=A0ABW0KU29_9BACT